MSLKIPGVPGDWEVVRVGEVEFKEHFIDEQGKIQRWEARCSSNKKGYVIVKRAVKPKQFRPFANAAEFREYKNRWITRVDQSGNELPGECRVAGFDDHGFWLTGGVHVTWADAMQRGHKFIVGPKRIPFGIEVA